MGRLKKNEGDARSIRIAFSFSLQSSHFSLLKAGEIVRK